MESEKLAEFSPDEEKSKVETEKGKNNRILIKIMRHGEKTPEGLLTDYGREETSEKSKKEKELLGEFDMIKVVGSDSGEKGPKGIGRALETADIYAEESIFNDDRKKYKSRPRRLLSLDGLKTSAPFDWTEYYKSKLPDNFDKLSDERKSEASHKAHEACLNRILTMPEAEEYCRDIASRHAFFINRYLKIIEKLKSNTKVLYSSGAHGGCMEVFLQRCLKIKKKEEQEKLGFKNVDEVGGAFYPSEGFFVDITTDEKGEKQVKVFMDNPKRLEGEELTLDPKKIDELVEEYEKNYMGRNK